jgi:hypothetical protein
VASIPVGVSSEAQQAAGNVTLPLPGTPTPSSTQQPQVQSRQTASGPARESIDRFPAHLHIEEWERNFMKTLHDLIPSPRAGKRFINIYRLLRASVGTKEQDQFVGDQKRGEYQCALMLLAILTGYPAEATEILRTLIEGKHTETWGELLSSFNAKVAGETSEERGANSEKTLKEATGRKEVKSAGLLGVAGFPIPQAQNWLELFNKLARIEDNLSDRSCRAFSKWAPRVARYSFQSGRVLLRQRE